MNKISDLSNRLRRKMVQAISDYHMIADKDRIMVAVSGGKDSAVLLALLAEVQKKAVFSFSFDAVMLDQKQPGFDCKNFASWVQSLGLSFHLIEEDTYSIVRAKTEEGKSYCGLCSRLRRGVLYNYAFAKGYSKIALGHHRDDANQTFLMNLFYNGAAASMPPKLFSDDSRNTIIRPLIYCAEEDIAHLADTLAVPIIPCRLCGSQERLQRSQMKELIKNLSHSHPQVAASLFMAQANLKPSQLMDPRYFDFKGAPSVSENSLSR